MKKGSQLKDGMAVASTMMEKSLAVELDQTYNERGERHAKMESLLVRWLDKWALGVMPSVYIGARADHSIQRSYYLTCETADRLKKVATHDGVSVSHVIRTAFAWNLYGRKKPRDVWGTEELFGERTDG